jgi:NADH-quinone oxidoreductase subunit M
MFGPLTHPENQKLEDLNARELGLMIPLLVAIIVMGVFPNFVFKKMNPSIDRVIAQTLGANKHE